MPDQFLGAWYDAQDAAQECISALGFETLVRGLLSSP